MIPFVIALVLVAAGITAAVVVNRVRRLQDSLAAARAAAKDAVERKLNVLEAVGDGIYILDADLRITHANEEAERLLRAPAGTLVGRRLDEIVDPLASELVPEIRAASSVERYFAFPATQTWVEVRVHRAAAETLVSLRDVSERTRAELSLRKNEQRLQLVTQHVDAVLWTTDREGRFTTVAGGALGDLGLSTDELIGRPCEALISGTVLRDVFTGTPVRVENAWAERWLRHHVEPLTDENRNVVGAAGVSIDITELNRVQNLLFEAAHRDRLTGLPNRLSLEQRLREAIAAGERDTRPFAVLFLDLDRFKTINDSLGHSAGDDVLRAVARRLADTVLEGDVIARPGGDEFVMLLPGIGAPDDIQSVSQRLLRALAAPFVLRDRELHVTASIGVAVFPEHGSDAEALIAHADAAMYRAKATGGDRCAVFDVSMHSVAVDRLALENDLRHVEERGELELLFQPIVGVREQDVVGCEALVRWRHPTRGLIPPDAFIGVAEETGSIVPIDRWVLREACAAAALLRRVVPTFRVAVNVSSRDLREPDLPDLLMATLAQHGLPASAIGIEITETVSLDDSVLPVLRRLHALGVLIAMDDFGIGYSSLSYLKRLPISVLKVDRSFVRDVVTDPYDQAIVASIVAVAKALGFGVIAEGVESDEQFERIASLGCDEAQGFRFGRPQTLAELTTALGALPRSSEVFAAALA